MQSDLYLQVRFMFTSHILIFFPAVFQISSLAFSSSMKEGCALVRQDISLIYKNLLHLAGEEEGKKYSLDLGNLLLDSLNMLALFFIANCLVTK